MSDDTKLYLTPSAQLVKLSPPFLSTKWIEDNQWTYRLVIVLAMLLFLALVFIILPTIWKKLRTTNWGTFLSYEVVHDNGNRFCVFASSPGYHCICSNSVHSFCAGHSRNPDVPSSCNSAVEC